MTDPSIHLKPGTLPGLLGMPPEGWRAIETLECSEISWRDIHMMIQSGMINVPDSLQHLQHASNVLAAIENRDELLMLRSLVKMIDATHESMLKEKQVEITRVIVEQLDFALIKNIAPLASRGLAEVRAGEKSAAATWGPKEERKQKKEKEAESMLIACMEIHRKFPHYKLGIIRKTVARNFGRSEKYVARQTPQLKILVKKQ